MIKEKKLLLLLISNNGAISDEISSALINQITINEGWLHQSPFKENLDQALEWNAQNPLQNSDLAVLENQLDSHE